MTLFGPITVLGRRTLGFFEFVGGVGFLLRDAAAEVPRGLIARRGRRMGWVNLWAQMVRVGIRSVPIVVLVLFCIGAILVRACVTCLFKAGVFGVLISSLACYLGLEVTGGAQGVGVATTRTVVLTIVALIAVDLMFTGAFYYFGW